jgi:signal transduction histidine kinase
MAKASLGRPSRVLLGGRSTADERTLLEAVLETTADAVLVVAPDGRMVYFNRRFVELWAIPDDIVASRRDDEALGAVREQLIDPAAFLDRVGYLYAHPREESIDELRLRDGRILERRSAPLVGSHGQLRGRVWFFRDVTDARRDQAMSDLLALSGELFGSPFDIDQTLSQLAEIVVPALADWAAVDVLGEGEGFRRVGVAHVDPEGADVLRELHQRYPLRANEGNLRGRVLATLEPIALYDVDPDELRSLARDAEHYELLRRLGVRSAMWVPLIVRGRVVGVLSAGYRDGTRRYTPADLKLLGELARRAALAVDNALLYHAVDRAETREAALATLGQQALTGVGYRELAQAASEALAEVMAVPFVEVLELVPNRRKLLLVAGVGWQAGMVGSATVKAGLGSQGGYTLATVGPVVVDNLRAETRFNPPLLLADHRVISGLTVIIGSPAHPYGVLGTHSAEHRVFAEDDVNFLQAIANVLAAAIERHNDDDRLNSLASAERARAAQLRAVIKSIGDAVVVCDALGGVLLANPAAEALLGDSLTGGLAGILSAFAWPTEQAADEPVPAEGIELRLAAEPAGDGSERWIELSAFPVLNEGSLDAAGGTVLLLRDVTAARNARAVRDAFLGVLSHELRTPVTTIYGGTAVLARQSAQMSEDSRREVYEDIRSEADRLYRLVENLLVLSRVERQGLQIETEPVLLQRLVPRVAEAESARWPSARWQTKLPPGLPPVAAEETYIEQVLRNLLGNAAKYGGDGPVTISAVDNGATVMVSVADTGPGFPEVEAVQLFELFYRSPSAVRRASGAGIGLFVSRQLVAAMGGRMWARNLPAGGAEFCFEIPVFPG